MIGNILSWIGDTFSRLFNALIGFLSDIFGYVFGKLFELLKLLFKPIFALIAIVFYLLYKIAALAIVILELLLGIGKLFFALVKGIFLTLAGFQFTADPDRDDGQWTSIFANVADGLAFFQLDTLAYILIFMIWFGTAFAAIRLLSNIKGGG